MTCPADTVIDGEGNNLSATATVADLAGNVATATVSGIKIDRTHRHDESDAPAAVAEDRRRRRPRRRATRLSKVAATRYMRRRRQVQNGSTVAVSGEGVHTLEFWSVDVAGNEEAHHTGDDPHRPDGARHRPTRRRLRRTGTAGTTRR